MEKSGMNPDIDVIIDKVSDSNFLSKEIIQSQTDKSFAELQKREWFCDIKISDYVENNVFGKRLFYSVNHPTAQGLVEISRRILQFIGMHSDNFIDFGKFFDESNIKYSLMISDIPIYPSVTKFFDFAEEPQTYFANYWCWKFNANFREFQREYIRQCWAEKFTK